MVKDEWMRAAMSDDMLVVELLVRLKQSQAASPLKSPQPPPIPQPATMLPFSWSVRMPRSRPLRCDSAAVSQRKHGDSTRCSPTTPLSWSGGASPSATADGFEESSKPTRSKGTATNESASTINRRSRKKKTFAELKDEEGSLLKERAYLKRELAKLRATCKGHRVENESLKRIKIDMGLHSAKHVKPEGQGRTASSQPHKRATSALDNVSYNLPRQASHNDHLQSDSCGDASETTSKRDSFFLLPDLNSMPSEEEAFYGMS
ncbi:hypothetical protein UlMin_035924 [Ulmus minor]